MEPSSTQPTTENQSTTTTDEDEFVISLRPQTNFGSSGGVSSSSFNTFGGSQKSQKEKRYKESTNKETFQQRPHQNKEDTQTQSNKEQEQIKSRKYEREFLFEFSEIHDIPEELEKFIQEQPDIAARKRKPYNKNNNNPNNRQHSNNPNYKGKKSNTNQTFDNEANFGPDEKVELRGRSENPWIPASFNEKEKKAHIIQGMLNRLTLDSFDKLSDKLAKEFCKISDADLFSIAIGLIFDKALSEPGFSSMYANLCLQISESFKNSKNSADGDKLFRRELLNKCQYEFENEKEITEISELDPSEVKEKGRKRKLGNVVFIGELFKRKLLPEKIIHDCIKSLIEITREKSKSNEINACESNAEILCKLISSVGKLIDIGKGKQFIEQYFSAFRKFQANTAVFKPRIKFMFQDVIELRERNWIPRREENNPKKISEIHEEALQKEANTKLETQIFEEKQSAPASSSDQAKNQSLGKQPKKGAQDQSKQSKSKTDAAKPSTKVDVTNVSQLEDYINNVFETYFSNLNVKEAFAALEELRSSSQALSRIVDLGILASCEKNDPEREYASKLFSELHKNGILNESTFIKGVSNLLESWNELKIDYPFFQTWMDKFIGLAINDGITSLSAITKSNIPSQPHLESCKYTI